MQRSYARSWSFIGLVTLAQLNLNQPSVSEAQKQLNEVAKESQENSRYWTEKHQKDDTNQKLNDIEDAITFGDVQEDN